jgi:hypothetical protein
MTYRAPADDSVKARGYVSNGIANLAIAAMLLPPDHPSVPKLHKQMRKLQGLADDLPSSDDDPRTIANRDPSEDQPCQYCYEPLWQIHPEAEFTLQWGHITREAAERCTATHKTGIWPSPRAIWPSPRAS